MPDPPVLNIELNGRPGFVGLTIISEGAGRQRLETDVAVEAVTAAEAKLKVEEQLGIEVTGVETEVRDDAEVHIVSGTRTLGSGTATIEQDFEVVIDAATGLIVEVGVVTESIGASRSGRVSTKVSIGGSGDTEAEASGSASAEGSASASTSAGASTRTQGGSSSDASASGSTETSTETSASTGSTESGTSASGSSSSSVGVSIS